MTTTGDAQLREQVRARYAAAATAVSTGWGWGCGTNSTAAVEAGCAPAESGSCCSTAAPAEVDESFGSALYDDAERGQLPEEAVLASLGCGNPVAVADLHPGEQVLDLGS